jgi:hypothetical protein
MAVRLRVPGGTGVPVSPKVTGRKRDAKPASSRGGVLGTSSPKVTEKVRGHPAKPAAHGAPGAKRVR